MAALLIRAGHNAILLTGGAGYIGSHTYLRLLDAGHEGAIVDNLSNASPEVIARLEELSGKPVTFFKADLRDRDALGACLDVFQPECVIHFAGLKSVGESVSDPLGYYENNVVATHVLLGEMNRRNIKKLIFSSTAAVYGAPEALPMSVDHPTNPMSPYGKTKLVVEMLLKDLVASDPEWSAVLLRYFNPVGAHSSGRIGESPVGVPNNLVPYVAMVAAGRLEQVAVFGSDFDTPDGTGVRDYIHVNDLAEGHIAAMAALEAGEAPVFNLGTGRGSSVLDVIRAYSEASGCEIPFAYRERRPGDVGEVYADASKAEKLLGWTAQHSIEDMCRDSWNWQSRNPRGYE